MTYEEALKLLNRTDCQGCEYYVPFGCEECYKAGRLGAKALEHQMKYRWHDLRKDSNDLPNEDGWVSCWLRTENINYGMDLFFKSSNKKFIDNRRKSIFEIYKVIDFFGKQIFTCEEVDRTDSVIAWRYIEPFED